MMPEDVRKAICYGDECWNDGGDPDEQEMWQTIRAHLLARDAEVEELKERVQFWKDSSDHTNESWQHDKDRAERADALLRFLRDRFGTYMDESDKQAITAHLSENSRG